MNLPKPTNKVEELIAQHIREQRERQQGLPPDSNSDTASRNSALQRLWLY